MIINDFSIENASRQIYSPKTKEYFQEVISSYHNSNNRAAIVTLYSVVITDLLEKLETLEDIYNDASAKSILDETKAFQASNPADPEWEKDLINKVKNRTAIFDNVDYIHIQALRNDRHLCAHPVINKDDKLYTPSKELVAAHIRNMLESLFLKPPILSKKILSTILVDIAAKKDILIDDESIEKYVKSKYLHNLNQTIENALFRDLWKFVFRLTNEQCEENRALNYRVLLLLYNRNATEYFEIIKSEKEYYSSITDTDEILKHFILFNAYNEFFYPEFREDVHLLVETQVKKNPSAKLVGWFLNANFSKHLEILRESITSGFEGVLAGDADISAYKRLIKIGKLKGYDSEILDFIVWRYSHAKSYNDADKIFAYLVNPNLDFFTKQQFEELAKESDNNSQTYSRGQANLDHKKLKSQIENRFPDFNFGAYRSVFR